MSIHTPKKACPASSSSTAAPSSPSIPTYRDGQACLSMAGNLAPQRVFSHGEIPVRLKGHPISKTQCNPQSQSPLFGLPAELRNRIFEYVVGSGTIHVDTRPCTHMERYAFHFACDGRCAHRHGPLEKDFAKFTYAVCPDPHYWSELYAQSKTDHVAVCDNLWHFEDCLSKVVDSFAHESMAALLLHLAMLPGTEADQCKLRADHIDRLRTLRQRHAGTGLDLALLQTCRLIYHETWKLPFVNYVFDLPLDRAWHFGARILFPHQIEVITDIRIHMNGGPSAVDALGGFVHQFSGLKRLQLEVFLNQRLTASKAQWTTFFRANKVESARVIVEMHVPDQQHHFEAVPSKSARMEEFMLKLSDVSDDSITQRLQHGVKNGLCEVTDL